MRKFLVMLGIVCFCVDNSIAIERCNTLGRSDIYTSNEKYRNPFPYNIELKSSNVEYNWNGSSIIAQLKNKKKESIDYKNFIDNVPNIIYDFKKKFHKNSEEYFNYLLKKSYDDIDNNIIPRTNNGILETYHNPFNKNPFVFKIEEEVFQWKDSKIFVNKYCSKYNSRLNNILIDFNDSFEYFIYLIQKFMKLKSYKIDINIKCNGNIYNNYSNLTLETPICSPLDDNLMVVIKDCIRTYRWYHNTIEILFPDWLNDNLSKNKYSVFLQLLEKATKDFNKNTKHKKELEDFEYFINKEFGNNTVVYSLNMDNLGWENITSTKESYISTVTNHKTGFVEVEQIKSSDYDWNNDKDDF